MTTEDRTTLVRELVTLLERPEYDGDQVHVISSLAAVLSITMKKLLQLEPNREPAIIVSIETLRRGVFQAPTETDDPSKLVDPSKLIDRLRLDVFQVMSRPEYQADVASACAALLDVVGAIMRDTILLHPELPRLFLSQIDLLRRFLETAVVSPVPGSLVH